MKKHSLPLVLLLALLGTFTPLSLTAQSTPEAWPGSGANAAVIWVGYTYSQPTIQPIQDPDDVPTNQIEFNFFYDVNYAPYSVQFAASPTMAFFRMQILSISTWKVGTYLIYIADANGNILGRVYLTLSGNSGQIFVANSSTSVQTGTGSHASNIGGWGRISAIASTTHKYVDFQVPLATLYSTLGINANTILKFYLGSSTGSGNINNINIDWMTPSTNSVPTPLDFASLSTASVTSFQAGHLPVELTAFTAYAKNGVAQLRWTTATETNNFGFEVQRSVTAESWETIDFVAGHGNSFSPRNYSYDDKLPQGLPGVLRYRLKQIDRDGTTEYSPVVMVKLAPVADFGISEAFPNPFNPSTTLSLRLAEEANVTLTLHDMSGKLVQTLLDNSRMDKGSHSVMVNAAQLPSGRYLAVMQSGSTRSAYPLVLNK